MSSPSWRVDTEGGGCAEGPPSFPPLLDRPAHAVSPLNDFRAADCASWVRSLSPSTPRAGDGWPRASATGATSRLEEALGRMPEVGDEFLGFRLVAELGRGAFARVFLASQGDLADRPVVLKIAAELDGETRTLARLQHTHIVPIYSAHRAAPFQALCMPYLGPTTLADVLRDVSSREALPASGKGLITTLQGRGQDGPGPREAASSLVPAADPTERAPSATFPPVRPVGAPEPGPSGMAQATRRMLEGMSYVESVLWIVSCLADGLAHAHERGILHRDLKPANVLMTDEGQPLLLDFNLSQDVTAPPERMSVSIGGTLPYMGPEHLDAFRGGPGVADARSDIYSLGVILYELLTGRPPFPRRGEMMSLETVDRMIEDRLSPPPDPRHWNPSASPAVASIVRHCLEPDPGRRYQSAHELREDLRRQLEDRPLRHAPEPSPGERLRKWARRHPRLTSSSTLAVVALTLTLGLAGGLGLGAHRAELRERARETRARFQRELHEARAALNTSGVDGARRREGMEASRRALGCYPTRGGSDWRDTDLVRLLDPDEQRRLSEDLGEALWLLARATWLEATEHPGTAGAEANVRRALEWNLRAEGCYPPGCVPPTLWAQRAELLGHLGRADEARHWSELAAGTPPRAARDHYLAAADLAIRGHFAQALAPLREATRLDPSLSWAWLLRGVCHDRLGQDVDALACYQAGIALRPGDPWPHFNRGLVNLRRREPGRALADFDEALRLASGRVEPLLNRALALHALGRHDESIRDLDAALRRGAAPARALFMRARVREDAGDLEGARRDRELGMRHRPTDEPSWVARGLARSGSDPEAALEDFRQALRINPRSLAALQNTAHVLSGMPGREEEAIAALDRALAAFPDYVPARSGRGILLARLGRRREALEDAEGALARDASPAILYQVTGIYAQTSRREPGDRRLALGLLARALREGFGWDLIGTDPDLGPIRGQADFERLTRAALALDRDAAAPTIPGNN